MKITWASWIDTEERLKLDGPRSKCPHTLCVEMLWVSRLTPRASMFYSRERETLPPDPQSLCAAQVRSPREAPPTVPGTEQLLPGCWAASFSLFIVPLGLIDFQSTFYESQKLQSKIAVANFVIVSGHNTRLLIYPASLVSLSISSPRVRLFILF